MNQSIALPLERVNPFRVIRSEESPTYDAGATATDPPTVTVDGDITADILSSCGAMSVAIWHIAVSNCSTGMPNTYAILEEQCELSTRQMQRLVNRLEMSGFIAVERGRGRGKETRITPLKYDRKGDSKGDTDVVHIPERVTESTTERVTSPPLQPPVNVKANDESVLTPPLISPPPDKPKRPKDKTPWPEWFVLTDDLRESATRVGIRPDRVDAVWEDFRDKAAAKGYRYADWPAAWRSWVRSPYQDHDRVGGQHPNGRSPTGPQPITKREGLTVDDVMGSWKRKGPVA